MKAIRIREFGGPDKVRVEDVPIPDLKAGEALVRVRAAAVNPVDWAIREKIYNPEGADRVPMTLGQDFAGEIERLAPDAKGFSVGDEVIGEVFGAFAEWVAAPTHDLVKKPASLDFVTAASIPMPALTGRQAALDTGEAKPGMRFLIHGAAGGVGSFAAQFAARQGATIIATASRASFDFLRSIGVAEIIDYEHERFDERVHDVDVVMDPFGGEVQARSFAVLKRGGLLINLVGEIDEAAAKRAGVRAVMMQMKYDTRQLAEIVDLIARGSIKPHISQVLSLDEARRAMELNQRNQSHGKIVLKVA